MATRCSQSGPNFTARAFIFWSSMLCACVGKGGREKRRRKERERGREEEGEREERERGREGGEGGEGHALTSH